MTNNTRHRPGYTASAAAVSLLAAPWWNDILASVSDRGPWVPPVLAAAALAVTWTVDRMYDTWILRVAAFVPATAMILSLVAGAL